MTLSLNQMDIAEMLEQMSKRLYKTEQLSGTPRVQGTISNSVTVDGIVLDAISLPPTSLILSTGSFMEEIWVDASWTAPADDDVSGYDVEVARKVSGVYQLQQVTRVGGTSLRVGGLLPQTVYGIRVATINRIGVRSTYLPASGFTDITTGIDATVPAQVSNTQISAGFRTATVTWNEVADRDVARGTGQYRVDLATNSGFTLNLVTRHVTGTIASFSGLTTGTTYFTRVAAIDNSGNQGTFSTTVSATTAQVSQPDIANLSIGTAQIQNAAILNAQIANLAVDNAKISDLSADKLNVGTLAAARIAANSLDVEKLTSSNMSSVNLTITGSGAIKVGTPPTTGLLINSQGLRLYASGVAKVILDNTGNATFQGNVDASSITSSTITGTTITGGTIRTASSGIRVALESGNPDKIKFYSGLGTEVRPGDVTITQFGDSAFTRLRSPQLGTGGGQITFTSTADNDTASGFHGVWMELLDGSDGSQAQLKLQQYDSGTGLGDAGVKVCEVAGVNRVQFVMAQASAVFKFDTAFGSVGNSYMKITSPAGNIASIGVTNGQGNRLSVLDGTASSFTSIVANSFDVIPSSITKKRNVKNVPEALSVLEKLRVVQYQLKEQDRVFWGVIAEETKPIFSQAVIDGEVGMEEEEVSIDLASMVFLTMKGLQELNALVKEKL